MPRVRDFRPATLYPHASPLLIKYVQRFRLAVCEPVRKGESSIPVDYSRGRIDHAAARSFSLAPAWPLHLGELSQRLPAMSTPFLDPVDLSRLGFEALVAALGWVNAVRFLQQYETSPFDYTREREQFLPDWDAETLVRKARERASK